ncbi:NAD(P)-binding protein [Truncatella angustata]|uniref:NAD(P)-binding protein n=1 Tax=Truncatella angustata TaxID=152316 RepID=A0A9P8RR06_9PEZI|nr:NAD(P)-binding protein [Truncatella angustata]KAH6647938.1 NAD(P)-binding protein [Truncatella angustata]
MASQTVVFISGVSRGIGEMLAQTYLSKPNHTVIGSTRSGEAAGPNSTPAANGSKFISVKIESTTLSDPEAAVKEIIAAGIDHVDVVVANAGVSPALLPPTSADLDDVSKAFTVNTLGPWALFKAFFPLLEKSKNAKWVAITTAVASLGAMEVFGAYVAPGYGISKVGLGWLTLSAHCQYKWLTAFVLHPGLVQTDMGNAAARMMGLEQAPDTKEKSAQSIIDIIAYQLKIEKATRKETSGKFFNAIDGAIIPW